MKGYKKSRTAHSNRPGQLTKGFVNHENICIIPREHVFDKGGIGMIPENLREQWAREVERRELLFLACNGGGWPDVLKDLEPAGRRVALRRIGFRGAEEYDMPIDPMKEVTPDNREPWVRLTNGVAVCLRDGFVYRGGGRRCRHE